MMRISVLFATACLLLSATALAQNSQPQCNLAVSQSLGPPPLTITATATCTDPGNDITTVTLDWGDGSLPATSIVASFQAQHIYTSLGTFTLTLTASDLSGLSSVPQTATVTVNAAPTCTLNASPLSGAAPLTVTATGNCTDTDGDPLTETLNWGDGTTTNGASGTHTYRNRGTFTLTLTATDPPGLTGTATQSITVNRNQSPTCTLTVAPNSGPAPLTVTATGVCTDADGDTLTTSISWGDGTSDSSGSTGTHTYNTAGNFTVKVTASDPSGNQGSAAQAVSVASSTPACSPQVSPTSGNAPLSVTVTVNCSDSGNDLSSVVTDFGDSFYLTGNSVTHAYVSGGSYTLTVVAHDRAGNSSQTFSQNITVSDDSVLFAGISSGEVEQFSRSGNSQRTLNSNQGGSMTGMSFDALDNLYTTNFTANAVSRFNGAGTLMGTFGGGYNCKPESIVFDRSGNAYVGETGCSHAILKLDAYGNLEAAYPVATEQEGSDWIDLASDQCTILYTSQGASVLAYNVCTKQQLPTFATGLNTGLAVKILPDKSVLVADKQDVVRFDSNGRKIMTYNASGENCFVSLTLDSDHSSFWAADYCSSDVVQFSIDSGNEISKFNTGTATNTVYGITERVSPARVTPAGPLTSNPSQASVSGGQSANFTLNFAPNGAAAGNNFTFSCADLPANSSCSFSPSTVPAGSGPVSTQLTLTTAGASARLARPETTPAWALALALPWLGMAPVLAGGEQKRRCKRLVLVLLLLACLVPLLSCSGASGSSSSTPPPGSPAAPPTPGSTTPSGTYTVVVHASSNAGPQSSTALTLTVQ